MFKKVCYDKVSKIDSNECYLLRHLLLYTNYLGESKCVVIEN